MTSLDTLIAAFGRLGRYIMLFDVFKMHEVSLTCDVYRDDDEKFDLLAEAYQMENEAGDWWRNQQ